MLKDILVDVTSRAEMGKNVSRRLRRDGKVPAIVYGMGKPAVPITVDPKIMMRILASKTGENTVLQLRLDGQEEKKRHVMIREHQDDPVKGGLVHVDFLRVDMGRKVQVEVPLETVGVASGVKNQGGLMDFVVRTVLISCLPEDIPEHMSVDVTPLEVGGVFRAKDLAVDEKIELLTDAEQALVVIAGRGAEEEEAAAAIAETAEAQATEEGKEEAVSGEEGKGKE